MTGSPVTKSPLDLFSQIQFLDPYLIDQQSYYSFRARYAVIVQRSVGTHSFQHIVKYQRLDELQEKVKMLSSKYELPLDLEAPITTLSAGEKQRVEIIRILLQDPKLLIMDEPTSVLTPNEIEKLFVTLDKLIKEGRTILYITHKLEEVIKICNEVTIMRNGKVIETCEAKNEN